MDGAIAKLLVQLVQRQVRARGNQRANQRLMPLQGIRLPATRSRPNRASTSEPLHQLDYAAHADRKLPGRRVPRNSTLNRCHNPSAQVL